MQRFEFDDGKSKKFWEIALDGNTFTVRYGRIGTDGQSSTKVFPTEDKARAEAEKVLLSKTKKGYVEVAAAPVVVEGNPTLESAILADRTDRSAWQVYADWLQSEGDPRGDLVAVQLGLAANPTDKELIRKAAELLAGNKRAFFGDIDPDELEDCFEVEWENGFWKRVKIKVDWDHEEVEFTKLLGQVLRNPSALFLGSTRARAGGQRRREPLRRGDQEPREARQAPRTAFAAHRCFRISGRHRDLVDRGRRRREPVGHPARSRRAAAHRRVHRAGHDRCASASAA